MRTVHEVSALTGVSIRALQYDDRIGLLCPAVRTDSGYRLYDDAALERLQQILLFRELAFPLRDIRAILDHPGFDRDKALEQQITLLTMKKEQLEKLIDLARRLKAAGGKYAMSFEPFDTGRIEAYAAQAKASWGATPQYREYEEKAGGRTAEANAALGAQMMEIFDEFGALKDTDPADAAAQKLVEKLQRFITAHFYACSSSVLQSLGRMYAEDGRYTAGIDGHAGAGTAAFVSRAIDIYCPEEKDE